jgi:hypothetical protein
MSIVNTYIDKILQRNEKKGMEMRKYTVRVIGITSIPLDIDNFNFVQFQFLQW